MELLDTEVENTTDAATAQHFTTDEPVEIPIGESVGNEMFVRSEYFVAMSVDGAVKMNPIEAMQEGVEVDEEAVSEDEDGNPYVEVEVDESSVFVSNEDGDVGGGVLTMDGGDVESVLDEFAAEYL